MHVYKTSSRKTHADFKASDILDYLDKALVHFNVHAFSLQDASFTYEGVGHPEPLRGDHINLSVSNFTHVNNEDNHLLGSDKVSLSMGPQHWAFSGGKHEIDFQRLRFDSKGQRFELDSFAFRQLADSGRGEIRLAADKFFFDSHHLPAIYQKNELLLDTVTCVNPVLTLPTYSGQKLPKDSAGRARYRNSLFKHINVRFINVVDGDLVIQSKDGRQESASTRKANLSVFNLDLNPLRDPPLSTDSVRINLRRIGFLTRDSLYKLSIGEFTIHGEDAVFRDVIYEPTLPGRTDKEVSFTAPALILHDISIGDLLQRHVRASGAELVEPTISMEDKLGLAGGAGGAGRGARAGGGAGPSSAAKMALFYKTLHNISELIDVEDFSITHGAAHYKGVGTTEGNVADLNAHILLNNFFISDSLVDIKHAISDWRIGNMDLITKGLRITVKHYRFDGGRRISQGGEFTLKTATGLQIQASNIYWNDFDWDVYQKTKAIQIDSMRVESLTINDSSVRAAGPGAPGAPAKDLPVVRLGTLRIDRLDVRKASAKNAIYGHILGLSAQGLRSEKRLFVWDNARLRFSDIRVGGQIRVGEGSFDAAQGLTAADLRFQSDGSKGKIDVMVPHIRVDMRMHSTDLSNLSAKALSFEGAAGAYLATGGKDTLDVRATLDARMSNLRLSDRGRSFSADVRLGWAGGALRYKKDSTHILADGLTGSFEQENWRLAPGTTFHWQTLIPAATFHTGDIRYNGPQVTAQATDLSWLHNTLVINNFKVRPRLSQEATFAKARWQSDYITVQGQSVSMAGIRFPAPAGEAGEAGAPRDSTLGVHVLSLDGVSLSASRDKNIAFHHGMEKPMPTRLINGIPFSIHVDSILLQNDDVTYHERSVSTGQWSTIPIQGISGSVTNLRSRDNTADTLRLLVSGKLLGTLIRRFSYEEAYGDTLAPFTASAACASMDLTRFSAISEPAAAVQITGGRADTIFSSWIGNKYATYGDMHFYYHGLNIRVLHPKDPTKRKFRERVITVLANVLLPAANNKPSSIFWERDREKFVFNYWVKAQTSGLLSALGIRKNRKYRNRVKTMVGSRTRT
jgi:hypothetical protein